MALDEFSGGYYRTEMNVQPYEDGPVIEHGLYNMIDKRVYAQTDAPIMMRVGLDASPYFTISSEAAVPTDVLALPRSWMDDMDIDSRGMHNVFVLKPEHSYVLGQSKKLKKRFENHNINIE